MRILALLFASLFALYGQEVRAPHLGKTVPLPAALEQYQQLSGRTVIYAPQLPRVEVHVSHAAADDKGAVIANLMKAIKAHEVAVVEHGKKFAFAVPNRLTNILANLPENARVQSASNNVVFPPSTIRFTAADVLQVIEFYSDLSARTVLRPNHLPQGPVTLRSETPLSTEEAIWMIEAALRLGGLATVPAGDKFVYVIPQRRATDLLAFDPPHKTEGKAGLLKFIDADREQVLETYAALTGRKSAPLDQNVPHAKISLRSHGPLTPAEAAFALEAVAILNGLAFQAAGDDQVTLVPLALARVKTN